MPLRGEESIPLDLAALLRRTERRQVVAYPLRNSRSIPLRCIASTTQRSVRRRLPAQIRRLNAWIRQQRLRIISERNFARLQYVAARGVFEGELCVLLNEQNRGAA